MRGALGTIACAALLCSMPWQVASANESKVIPNAEKEGPLVGRVESHGGYRKLAFGASGRIERLSTEVGKSVRLGQVLAQLDCGGLKAQLSAAEAEAELHRLSIARRIEGASPAEREIAKERLALAESELNAAVVSRSRFAQLFSQNGLVSKQELETADRRINSARVGVAAARQAVDHLLAPSRPEDELADRARDRINRADVARVAHQLSLCDLRAPFDGIVAEVHLRAGEVAGSADPVVSVLSYGNRYVSVWIAESASEQLREGRAVRVRIPTLREGIVDGNVARVDPMLIPEPSTLSGPCSASCGSRVTIAVSENLDGVPLHSRAYIYPGPR